MFVQNFLAYYILATDLQSQYRSESVKICDMAVRRHFAPGRIAKYCKKNLLSTISLHLRGA